METQNIGVAEWFHPQRAGELHRAKFLAERLAAIGIRHLRFDISWAELAYEEWKGITPSFYDELIPLLARHFELLPNLMYTPPSLGITEASASPPRDIDTFRQAVAQVCTRWGAYFDYLELWNEANGHSYWNFHLDPDWSIFRRMISNALPEVRAHGKKAVLGGPSPFDIRWFRNMQQDGILTDVDVLGVHGFPGTFDDLDFPWRGWHENIETLQQLLTELGSAAEIWITEVGATDTLSTARQRAVFEEAVSSRAARMYWYSAMDFEGRTVQQIAGSDMVYDGDFHMGLFARDHTPKEFFSYLKIRMAAAHTRPHMVAA